MLNEAGVILGPDAGYNETIDLAEAMADDLAYQQETQYDEDIGFTEDTEDWGYW